MTNEHAPAPCAGSPTLFASTKIADHKIAARICARCPRFDACEDDTQKAIEVGGADGQPEGTWAGRFFDTKKALHEREARNAKLAEEESRYTPEQARRAHAAYVGGEREDPWVLAGNRVYNRRRVRTRAVHDAARDHNRRAAGHVGFGRAS